MIQIQHSQTCFIINVRDVRESLSYPFIVNV
jgi:hypothetical protein